MTTDQKPSIWENIFNAIVLHLKGRAFKLALKKILGSAYAVGFKGWLTTFILEELWDEVAVPVSNGVLVEIKYIHDKIDGNITAEKIEKARETGSDEDYDNAVDDLYS